MGVVASSSAKTTKTKTKTTQPVNGQTSTSVWGEPHQKPPVPIFEGGCQVSAKILVKALHPESMEYMRMVSFVRPDGDCTHPVQSLLEKKVLQKLTTLQAQDATTIFKARPNMPPFLHLQQENSYVCTYNAYAAVLHYSSYKNSKAENDNKDISTWKMNMSRYLRDEVSGLEITNFALTTVKGTHHERVLLGLMKSFGASDYHSVENIPTWDQDEKDNFSQLMMYLDDRRSFVFGVECFPVLTTRNYCNIQARLIPTTLVTRANAPRTRMIDIIIPSYALESHHGKAAFPRCFSFRIRVTVDLSLRSDLIS